MRINEIFVSLQGEGHFTGVPSVFLRFSGCNLKCPFCDTIHETYTEYDEDELVGELTKCAGGITHLVITGGEPSLQLTDSLVSKLHTAGFFVQVETNGTFPLPADTDWITCSPKEGGRVVLDRIDEVKLVCGTSDSADSLSTPIGILPDIEPDVMQMAKPRNGSMVMCLQPMDSGDSERNRLVTDATVNYILKHPLWKLSLQTHKILNVR